MPTNHPFIRDEILPSYFANAIQEFLAAASFGVRPERLDATTVQVPASASARAALAIEGRWRYVDATVTRAHPVGVAGVYPIFAVAADESVGAVPLPYTDNTDYSFALRVEAPGGTPTLGSGVDVYRQIGETIWSGSAIVGILSSLPVAPSVFAPSENLRIVRGTINADGTIAAVAGVPMGSGFTVVRNGLGNYTVYYAVAFPVAPSVVPGSGGQHLVSVESTGAFGVNILTRNRSDGAAVDGLFHFVATGPV